MLHLTKRQLERGLRRVNAEVRRPLLQTQDALRKTEKPVALYQPLREGCIRLLTRQVADDDTAICRFDIYPYHLAPRYDAISYCWGDDKTPTTINVNGFKLQIRKSLLAFLHFGGAA